jgi:DNA-binding response OmpR family regulator
MIIADVCQWRTSLDDHISTLQEGLRNCQTGRACETAEEAGMDAVSTDTFRLTLFGHFELAGRDGSIHLTRKKLAALLAFLARTAPEPHGRDKLMALFWGSHFEAQARQNLRQALRRLRCILGPHAFIPMVKPYR